MMKKIFFVFLITFVVGVLMQVCTIRRIRLVLPSTRASSPTVIVRTDSWESYKFGSENGSHCQINTSELIEAPILVLLDHHRLTDPVQRTLYIDVSGLQIPSSGAFVTLKVETQTKYTKFGINQEHRILVWDETKWIDANDTAQPARSSVTFSNTFPETVTISADQQIRMPTGYFRYQINVKNSEDGTTLYEFQQDHAFLIEDQCMSEWRA